MRGLRVSRVVLGLLPYVNTMHHSGKLIRFQNRMILSCCALYSRGLNYVSNVVIPRNLWGRIAKIDKKTLWRSFSSPHVLTALSFLSFSPICKFFYTVMRRPSFLPCRQFLDFQTRTAHRRLPASVEISSPPWKTLRCSSASCLADIASTAILLLEGGEG